MLNYLIDQYFIKNPRLRRWVTSTLEPDRVESIQLCGADLRVNRRREHGYWRASKLARRSSLFRDEVPILINLASILSMHQASFIDVGANVGIFTHSLMRLKNIIPNFRIFAFEPHPDTFERLNRQYASCAHFYNCGIGSVECTKTFIDGAVSHVFTEVQHANSYNIVSETITIQIKRLDQIITDDGPFVMKIDVEGQEFDVLQGSAGLFDRGAIQAVYMDGYKDPKCVDFLKDRGFRILNGKTLEDQADDFSLLAMKQVDGR